MAMPLPNLNLNTSSKSGADGNMGGSTSASRVFTKGDISINYGADGVAGGMSKTTIIAAVVVCAALYFINQKK